MHQGGALADSDGPIVPAERPIPADSPAHDAVETRLESAESYAKFATAVAREVLKGAPLKPFLAIGSYDDRAVRIRQQELREKQFAFEMEQAGSRLRRVTTA